MSIGYQQKGIVRFGEFELDPAGELRAAGRKIKLQDQPFQILQVLVERPGQIVTREELRSKIWPTDTFVDFDHGINNAIKRLREALGDTAETPGFIETVPRHGYRFIAKIERGAHLIRSLAVLPLANLSSDPEQEYFVEGLTEALITTLAKIGELRVVSRTSSMQYKDVRKPLGQIARELDVDAIVEGTVLRANDQVRITAQLIDAAKESHLWAESYERDLRDVLALQSEVAQAIAREIRVRLTPQEKAQFDQVNKVDPAAYEAYLKGRYYWNRRSQEGFHKGVQHFREAITKDPGFAAAYSGLADCLSLLTLFGFVAPNDGIARAKELAQRALELDPALPEAHASRAMIDTWYDFDFIAAERGYERSIELNPRYAIGHSWFGFHLGLTGRYEEAYTECKRSIRLDPVSSPRHWVLGVVHWMGRRYDQAIEACEKALEFDANFIWAHGVIGWANLANGLHESSIRAAKAELQLSPTSTFCIANLGEAYAAAGDREGARKILDQLDELSTRQFVNPYTTARIHAALGNPDEALKWLQAAYSGRHVTLLAFLKTDPQLDNLRDDPRFRSLMQGMKFPD
jgi:TolB-like protein/Flp pilus assembly protein TadD